MLTAAKASSSAVPAGPWGVGSASVTGYMNTRLPVLVPYAFYGRNEVAANSILQTFTFNAQAATTFNVYVLTLDGDMVVIGKTGPISTSGAGNRTITGLSLPLTASGAFGLYLPTAQTIGSATASSPFGVWETYIDGGTSPEPSVGTNMSSMVVDVGAVPWFTASGVLA